MNVMGIGIDIVDVGRLGMIIEKRGESFLRKIFTDKEMAYACGKRFSFFHIAGKFAAKEAVKKALPDGSKIGLKWADIEILNHSDGKPYVCLHGKAEEIMKDNGLTGVLVSISHIEKTAVSNAMVVKDG